ncbi:MAG: glycoside hydrolase family 130 protein [Elusimicrobiota bacterium]|jgi:predicted GH43/DUF377 family glycosyl hydrolase
MKRPLLNSRILTVRRTEIRLAPDQSRVVLRHLRFGTDEEYVRIIRRALALSEADVHRTLNRVLAEFSSRHRQLSDHFLTRFRHVEQFLPASSAGGPADSDLSEDRKQLIGSYFLFEYSVESAGLFNPSIIPHPDQSGLPEGHLRFLLSLRSTGEGHLSSISFRSGVIDDRRGISIDPPARFLTEPELIENPSYHKTLFGRKAAELGLAGEWTDHVLDRLPDTFTLTNLRDSLRDALGATANRRFEDHPIAESLWLLAKCNYEICFPPEQDLSECVIMPVTPLQSNGIEDVRLVAHQEENGQTIYYATYTAYDGRHVLPQLFTTEDFRHFKFTTLNGPGAKNKGMALFPRKINGLYTMLSRQDGDSLFLTTSDNIHFWSETRRIIEPVYPWEVVKMGNCGSPIETKDGWLVLSHGVGPLRQYCLGAFLLDRNDPSRVIGRLREPLMRPEGIEREGYVPNVLYTCGALVHGDQLILPYGLSDRVTGFALISLNEILASMS